MKKTILFISSALLMTHAFAQQQLPNSSFEEWDDVGTAVMEPKHWSSLKTADAQASLAPEVLSQSEGRTGMHSVLLEVKSVFGISANGIMTTGRIHADFNPANGYVYTDTSDPKWNMPFTDRPDSIVGWVKYDPKNGDRGKVEVLLHKRTEAQIPTNQATIDNTIATARFDVEDASTEWTRFSVPFTYVSQEDPEYILFAVASGDSTISKNGTKLWIDDLELIYNEDIGISNLSGKHNNLNVYGMNGYLHFEVKGDHNMEYNVVDVTGRNIQSGKVSAQVPFNHNSGIFFIQVISEYGVFSKKIYVQQ